MDKLINQLIFNVRTRFHTANGPNNFDMGPDLQRILSAT